MLKTVNRDGKQIRWVRWQTKTSSYRVDFMWQVSYSEPINNELEKTNEHISTGAGTGA